MGASAAVHESPLYRGSLRLHALAVVFAIAGGLLGILGAFVAEARSSVPFLLVFIGAPVAEEITKPAGIYIYLLRWPGVLRHQLHIASLTAISGLCFGLLESLVYVTVYNPDHSQAFFIYRFSVTVLLHGVCSFIAGLGVNSKLVAWTNGEAPFPRGSAYAFGVAIALHALYNTTVVILSLAGLTGFD
jgi:RsiW-degrading membrane proteinase PrsW (M82 family)